MCALSFKVGTLTQDADGGFCNASRELLQTNTGIYSVLMMFALLGGLLLFALMAPFEMSKLLAVPTVRLSATGEEPELMLPAGLEHHAFLSHAWASGQVFHSLCACETCMHAPKACPCEHAKLACTHTCARTSCAGPGACALFRARQALALRKDMA